jgi:hypothetical protein
LENVEKAGETMKKRFEDQGQPIEQFSDKFLVRCPRCEACASVTLKDQAGTSNKPGLFLPRRLICPKCGYSKDWQDKLIARFGAYDWYFRLPLWLQTTCCGETLWAFNKEHLDYLEGFVAAELRGNALHHHSLATRLPGWMVQAKNRAEILKAIARLRATLE